MTQPNFALSALYALDSLEVMRGMDSESVPFIYADPPFNSKRIYQGISGSKAATHRFRDTWSWNDAKAEWLDQLENDHPALHRAIWVAKDHSSSMGGYCAFMAVRLIEMHRILTPEGSLYLHCDPSANSYLRVLLDNIFGGKNLRNEIVWSYTGPGSPGMKQFNRKHDTIFWYSKGDKWTFHRDEMRVPYKDPKQTLRRAMDAGNGIGTGQVDEYRQRGKVLESWWTDIALAVRSPKERTGWATQKPLALLERIIKASSNEGDIVFDPFCGCGTALVAAENRGRRWVGADDDDNAIDVVRERVASLKGILADQPQFQTAVSVLRHAPVRTEAAADDGVLKDPTGIIIPKMPSDKMSNAAIRDKLEEWQVARDGLILCPGCGERLKPRHFYVDHINPKSAGGTNRIDNRILLCGACNTDKGNTKTLPQLWNEQKIRGQKRQEMQRHVKDIQDQARAYVRQMDAGAPAQAPLP